MATYTAEQPVEGYPVELVLTGVGNYIYTVYNPDGSELIRASGGVSGRVSSLQNGLGTLADRAEASGNTQLAQTYRNISVAMGSVGPQLTDNVNQQYKNAVPPPPAEPVPPAVENTPNTNDINNTPASDDASYDKSEAARLSNYSNQNTASGSQQTDIVTKAGSGSTQAGSAGSGKSFEDKTVSTGPKPGTRLQNPLGNFASYTYQISLYMITPDAYDAFMLSGRKNINALSASDASGKATNGGAFLVAQSGGINNKTSQRAPGFELDFYIDDLKIKTNTSSKSTQTSSNATEISFSIIEPYGFSFITKLKNARDALKAKSKLKNYDKAANASKQFFILGIRFQGYDKDGNIANASQYFSQDTFNTGPDASGVYERFYDITIKDLKFKLTGGPTIYHINAVNIPTSVGMGIIRGQVDNDAPIVASTVEQALGGAGSSNPNGVVGLLDTINANQQKLKAADSIEIPNVYKIEWLGNSSSIRTATLQSDANPDKKQAAMSPASKSSQVNEKAADKAILDQANRLFTIKNGTPIPQAIKKIILQSSYIENALKTLYTTAEENDPTKDTPEAIQKKNTPPLKWYNLSTRVKCLGFDTKVGDFAYEITYVIQPYETPAAVSPYGNASKYYGPHKRYDYWFTGKNSEVISFEQSFDNAFFNIAVAPNGDPQAQGNGNNVATVPNKRTNQERDGRDGKGLEAQNTYMTSLFDRGAYTNMKITVLGDPDFLTDESPDSINDVYQQFYKNDGYTINPNGGQVFVEVAFNEAIDYDGIIKDGNSVPGDNGTGIMTVNDKINFMNYPPEVAAKIKGVVYCITTVESTFNKGKFTQVLTGFGYDFPASTTSSTPSPSPAGSSGAPGDQSDAETRRLAAAGNRSVSVSGSTGLKQDEPVGTSNNGQPSNLTVQPGAAKTTPVVNTAATTQQTVPTNNPATPQVQSDDAALANFYKPVTEEGRPTTAEEALRAGA